MFSCLHLPGFAVEAVLVRAPAWRAFPCAIVADSARSDDPKAPLLAVNREAAAHGLCSGESVIRAQLRCPSLRLISRDREAEADLGLELLGIAESLSPDFEVIGADTLILDMVGCRFPRSWQPTLPLRLSLAETPDLAHFAALSPLPFSVEPVRPEDFDPLPLGLLRRLEFGVWEKLIALLDLWGLRTLGGLRRLPRQELAERAGPDALRLHDILNARHTRLLKLHRPMESFDQIVHFDHSIDSMEALVFQSHRILQTLCSRLQALHLAAARIGLKLWLESHDPVIRQIHLPEPRVDPAALLAPLHTLLETLQVSSAVTALELTLEPVRPAAAQREWLGRQLSQPDRWPDTLARLEALLGHGRVGIPQPAPGHRPDDFEVRPLSLPPVFVADCPPDCDLPLRRFRPPLEVAVASTGRGLAIRPLALLTGPHAGGIRRAHGPFALSGDWWSPEAVWQRLEWDIEMENRCLLRLARPTPGRWFLDGCY
jgi:protein ImuB